MSFFDLFNINIPTNKVDNTTPVRPTEVVEVEQNHFSNIPQSQSINLEVKYDLEDEKTQNLLYNALENQVNLLNEEYKTAKKSNGWISGAWDWAKDTFNFGASSEKAQDEINKAKNELEKVKNQEIDIKEAYKNITGKEPTDDEIEQLLNGEISLKDISKAGESLNNYQEGQKMSTDVVADIVSGIASVGVVAFGTALGVCAAPFTAGASLGAIGAGVALAAGTGAAVKSAIKATDCIKNEKEYSAQDALYDIVTGSFNGAMGPISNGAGGAVGTCIMKAFGMEALETTAKTALKVAGGEIVEEIIEESAEAVAKNTGKTLLQKGITILAKGFDMATDGTLSGAADGFSRAAAEGRWEDIPQDTIDNALGGLIASPIIGAGFNIAGKAGTKLANTKAGEIAKELVFDNLSKAGDYFSDLAHQYTPNLANSFDNLGVKINDKLATTAINKAVVQNSDDSLSVTIGDYVINVASDEIPDEIKGDNLKIYSWLSQGLESFKATSLIENLADETNETVARAYTFNPETNELTPAKPKTPVEVEEVKLDYPEAGDNVGSRLKTSNKEIEEFWTLSDAIKDAQRSDINASIKPYERLLELNKQHYPDKYEATMVKYIMYLPKDVQAGKYIELIDSIYQKNELNYEYLNRILDWQINKYGSGELYNPSATVETLKHIKSKYNDDIPFEYMFNRIKNHNTQSQANFVKAMRDCYGENSQKYLDFVKKYGDELSTESLVQNEMVQARQKIQELDEFLHSITQNETNSNVTEILLPEQQNIGADDILITDSSRKASFGEYIDYETYRTNQIQAQIDKIAAEQNKLPKNSREWSEAQREIDYLKEKMATPESYEEKIAIIKKQQSLYTKNSKEWLQAQEEINYIQRQQTMFNRLEALSGKPIDNIEEILEIFTNEMQITGKLNLQIIDNPNHLFDAGFIPADGSLMINMARLSDLNMSNIEFAALLRHELEHFYQFAQVYKSVGAEEFERIINILPKEYQLNLQGEQIAFNKEAWDKIAQMIPDANIDKKNYTNAIIDYLRNNTLGNTVSNKYEYQQYLVNYYSNLFEQEAYRMQDAILTKYGYNPQYTDDALKMLNNGFLNEKYEYLLSNDANFAKNLARLDFSQTSLVKKLILDGYEPQYAYQIGQLPSTQAECALTLIEKGMPVSRAADAVVLTDSHAEKIYSLLEHKKVNNYYIPDLATLPNEQYQAAIYAIEQGVSAPSAISSAKNLANAKNIDLEIKTIKQGKMKAEITPEIEKTLTEISKELSSEYQKNISTSKDQYLSIFLKKGETLTDKYADLSARAKSTESTLAKLKTKYENGSYILSGDITKDIEIAKTKITDAYGARVMFKSLSKTDVKNILTEVGLTDESAYDELKLFTKKIIKGAAIEESDEKFVQAMNLIKEKQNEPFFKSIYEYIEQGGQIAEINNYGNIITSYFSEKQIAQLIDLYAQKNPGIILKVVSQNSPNIISNSTAISEISLLGKTFFSSDGTMSDNIQDIVTSEGAQKPSGYGSGHFTFIQDLNGTKAYSELQARSVKLNEYGDVEHIPYDMGKGKITAKDTEYSEIYNPIMNLDSDSIKIYKQYRKEIYEYLALLDKGIILDEIPTLKGLKLNDGTVLDDEIIKKLTFEGLLQYKK